MKITRRQIRRIIREELLREFNPQARGWEQVHGYATEAAPSSAEAKLGIEGTREAADDRRSQAESDPELDFMALDADDLISIADQFEYEIAQGRSPGSFSEELRNKVRRLDTVVREDIHYYLYYSLFPEIL